MIKPELLDTIHAKLNEVINGVLRQNLIDEKLSHEELKEEMLNYFTEEEKDELVSEMIFIVFNNALKNR